MKIRILVVDDEAMMRDFVCTALAGFDYEFAMAEDAASAIALLAQEQFHVVLTDKNMPGTKHVSEGGLDVLQFAKASNPACGVLMMTGYASVESAIKAMRLGAFDYICKPIRLGELREKVERIISYQRALDPADTLAAYEKFWREYLAAVEENQEGNPMRSQGQNNHLLKTLQNNLDLFFQERKTREHLIIEQRDALSRIATLASQLKERLPEDSPESPLLDAILRETERRL
ncbi:response regulator [Thiovibrio sp. JS02]